MQDKNTIVSGTVRFLEQGIEICLHMTDMCYGRREFPYEMANIGKHIRHVLEHYSLFLEGVGQGEIDYDDRERDPDIEGNRTLAIQCLKETKAQFVRWIHDTNDLDQEVRVCHNGAWCRSTTGRELQHLINHTVHHYALIAFIMRVQGESVAEDFGVAPSTLQAQTH